MVLVQLLREDLPFAPTAHANDVNRARFVVVVQTTVGFRSIYCLHAAVQLEAGLLMGLEMDDPQLAAAITRLDCESAAGELGGKHDVGTGVIQHAPQHGSAALAGENTLDVEGEAFTVAELLVLHAEALCLVHTLGAENRSRPQPPLYIRIVGEVGLGRAR